MKEKDKTEKILNLVNESEFEMLHETFDNDVISAYRMYFLPSGGNLCFSTSFIEKKNEYILDIKPLGEKLFTKKNPDLIKKCSIKSIAKMDGDKFLKDIEKYKVWEMEDCLTNSRDGISFYHVVANQDDEHCFELHNPHVHRNKKYCNLVNLYSDTFLDGYFSFHKQSFLKKFSRLWGGV